MNAQHIFEEGIYLLDNVAVAKNPLFRSEDNLVRFKNKTDEYLTPLCKIIAYAFHDNQWELLVKMKSREDFIAFYKKKHKNEQLATFLIPESAYIFSQEMANLQSGFVKHYNWFNKRVGALFYRRYQKELISSNEEMESTVVRLNKLSQKNPHKGEWAIQKIERLRKVGNRSSLEEYDTSEKGIEGIIEDRLGMNSTDLEVYFEALPALKIENPIPRLLRQFFKILAVFEAKF